MTRTSSVYSIKETVSKIINSNKLYKYTCHISIILFLFLFLLLRGLVSLRRHFKPSTPLTLGLHINPIWSTAESY